MRVQRDQSKEWRIEEESRALLKDTIYDLSKIENEFKVDEQTLMTLNDDGDDQLTTDNIKYTMFYEKSQKRFFACENTYQYQKFYVLEYDQNRAKNGVGNHLTVTVYTVVATNIVTADLGRGERGLEIDIQETHALRNIVHFNCVNPFVCRCLTDDGQPLINIESNSASLDPHEPASASKNPFGQ